MFTAEDHDEAQTDRGGRLPLGEGLEIPLDASSVGA